MRRKRTYVDERAGVDADGEGADMRQAALKLNTVGHRRETKHPCAGRKEVTGIVVGVEADKITVEDAEQDLPTNREDTADRVSHDECSEHEPVSLTGRSHYSGRECAGRSRS
jgi:hypothetical protein